MTEKTPLLHYFVWFQIHNKRLQLESLSEKLYLFLKNYVTSDRAVSHNVTFNSSPLLVTKYTKSKSPRLHSQIKWNETRCTQSRRKKHPRIQWSYIGLLKHASKLGHHLPTFGNDSRSETSSCTLWGKDCRNSGTSFSPSEFSCFFWMTNSGCVTSLLLPPEIMCRCAQLCSSSPIHRMCPGVAGLLLAWPSVRHECSDSAEGGVVWRKGKIIKCAL